VAWLLSRAAAKSFAAAPATTTKATRVIAALVVDLPNWNWFRYPADYTLLMAVDRLIAWVLAGVVLAAIVRPQPTELVTA
jgi:membrane protein insertase Oxa1/YidC/SpoIIIJ